MKHVGFALVLSGIIAFCVVFFVFRSPDRSATGRVSIVVGSSPVSVWSWNSLDGTFIVMVLPENTVIEGTRGYGNYSLAALWKLGFIEKKSGTLLSESLSDALGVSIPWYMGTKSQDWETAEDILSYGKKLFSLAHIVSFVLGTYETNMPLGLFTSFVRDLSGARPDAISLINLQRVTREETLPDTTSQHVLDTQLVDVALKGVFEDDRIRKEGVSVGLYNTTQTPALGNRAARLLASSGILVLFVGNSEQQVSECQLEGDKKSLATLTARVISELLNCKKVTSTDQKRTDLTVYIGLDFAKRYVSWFSSGDSTGSPSSPVGVISGASTAVEEPPLAKGM